MPEEEKKDDGLGRMAQTWLTPLPILPWMQITRMAAFISQTFSHWRLMII